MRPIPILAAVVLTALVGCTSAAPDPTPTPAPTTAAPPRTDPTPVAGGCGDTPLWRNGEPDWIASAGPGLGGMPHALSHEGNLYAALFVPLRGGPDMTNPNNKILWIVREPREGKPLRLTLRPVDGTGPVVTQDEPANSRPGEIYPSIVDVPAPGCWAITAEWAGHRATMELQWM